MNPQHLRLGTPQENQRDIDERGRRHRGKKSGTILYAEAKPNAKLTWAIAEEIRQRYWAGEAFLYEIAAEMGVSVSSIHNLVHRVTYAKPPVIAERVPEVSVDPAIEHAAIVARFEAKVSKSDDPDACWLWMASKVPAGYGKFYIRGRLCPAHRVAWELHFGQPVPEGMQILHSCDNPACVNPMHLRPGTREENMQDMISRKREGWRTMPDRVPRGEKNGTHTHPEKVIRGENHHLSKITREIATEIRRCYLAHEMNQIQLGVIYEITTANVCAIIKNKTWFDPNYTPPKKQRVRSSCIN